MVPVIQTRQYCVKQMTLKGTLLMLLHRGQGQSITPAAAESTGLHQRNQGLYDRDEASRDLMFLMFLRG